jgi:GNAT superfamily N-acetyltransferase
MLTSSHLEPVAAEPRAKTVRCSEVDPCSHASAAAEVLRTAWAPPCLLYSDPYVKWQLTFPGPVPSRAVVATDGARAVGFVALIPRSIRVEDRVVAVYVLSFFAVHPDFCGAGVGARMARLILKTCDRPVLTYAEVSSASERALAASALSRGWMFKRIAEVRTYGFAGARGNRDAPALARQVTVREFLAALEGCTSAAVAWSRPTLEQVEHYAADPRGSCLAIVQGPNHRTLGGALIVRSQVITAHGTESVPSLDAVFLHGTPAPALAALAALARDHWPAGGASVVTAPNLHTVPPDAIRRAGFRATRSAFNLAIMGDESDPIVSLTATNLEVF